MLEYGEAYLEANERIIDAMSARMPHEAVELANRMAVQADEEELEELEAA